MGSVGSHSTSGREKGERKGRVIVDKKMPKTETNFLANILQELQPMGELVTFPVT
jgi:hypothetical protein